MKTKAGVLAAATVCAAAVLVAGADYATYAATGDSVILGRTNHASGSTEIVKRGTGPALRLSTEGDGRPSFSVSSAAKVPNLNADRLDGRTAADLATNVVTYSAGARGDELPGGLSTWPLPVRPGLYQVSFKAFLVPAGVPSGESVAVICGLADLDTIGPRTQVYTAGSTSAGEQFPALLSGSETVRIAKGDDPGLVCSAASDGLVLFQPLRSSWIPVDRRTVVRVDPAPSPVRNAFPGSLGRD